MHLAASAHTMAPRGWLGRKQGWLGPRGWRSGSQRRVCLCALQLERRHMRPQLLAFQLKRLRHPHADPHTHTHADSEGAGCLVPRLLRLVSCPAAASRSSHAEAGVGPRVAGRRAGAPPSRRASWPRHHGRTCRKVHVEGFRFSYLSSVQATGPSKPALDIKTQDHKWTRGRTLCPAKARGSSPTVLGWGSASATQCVTVCPARACLTSSSWDRPCPSCPCRPLARPPPSQACVPP